MSSAKTLYLNLKEISEVHSRDVYLRDVADVYCSDQNIQNRCVSMKIKTVRAEGKHRYVENALDIIRKLEAENPQIQVNNIGKVEYIIDYQPPHPPHLLWQWAKTIFVCVLCFCGAAFAIMTFNNDVSVKDVFREVYLLIMGKEAAGPTILELSYSVGLAIGILVFFNHFAVWKLNTDPTPLEVEMRLYEDNISKTLIQESGRKEQDVDIT
ncbi:MAG: stage V sporulation protein AA [Clostridiales bacterium]|nr:stage V sporulation protein AA [Clostridiales bacterium]